jgi:hypothetical protein
MEWRYDTSTIQSRCVAINLSGNSHGHVQLTFKLAVKYPVLLFLLLNQTRRNEQSEYMRVGTRPCGCSKLTWPRFSATERTPLSVCPHFPPWRLIRYWRPYGRMGARKWISTGNKAFVEWTGDLNSGIPNSLIVLQPRLFELWFSWLRHHTLMFCRTTTFRRNMMLPSSGLKCVGSGMGSLV